MKMFKKAQAAMEFLMTYGWAILVVLIAIGALAYFGVLNPNKFIADRCTISTGSGIFCQDYNSLSTASSGNQGISLILRNGLGDAINISTISFTYDNGAKICLNSTVPMGIQPDSQTSIFVANGTSCTGLTSGTKLKGDIKIVYTQGSSTLVKTTTGSLITTVQ